MLTHEPVDYLGPGVFRETRGDDCGLSLRTEGKIALVADADDFFVQAQSEQYLRSGRQ
jgi:hypothetical protein